jgi:hypothetical protein
MIRGSGPLAGSPVQFAAAIDSPIGTIDPIATAAADFNSDGILDIAAGAFLNNSIEILIGVASCPRLRCAQSVKVIPVL